MPTDLGSKRTGNSEWRSNASAAAGTTPVATVWFAPTVSDLTRRRIPPVSAASRSAASSAACKLAQNPKDRFASDVLLWITERNVYARSTCCQQHSTFINRRTTYNWLRFQVLELQKISFAPISEKGVRIDKTSAHLKRQAKLARKGLCIRFLFV